MQQRLTYAFALAALGGILTQSLPVIIICAIIGALLP